MSSILKATILISEIILLMNVSICLTWHVPKSTSCGIDVWSN